MGNQCGCDDDNKRQEQFEEMRKVDLHYEQNLQQQQNMLKINMNNIQNEPSEEFGQFIV